MIIYFFNTKEPLMKKKGLSLVPVILNVMLKETLYLSTFCIHVNSPVGRVGTSTRH